MQNITYNKTDIKNIVILSSIFATCLITANMIGSKLVLIYGFPISVGDFVFPLTFLMTDILSEIYGRKITLYVVNTGIFMQVIALFFIWLGSLLPSAPIRNLDPAYSAMFYLTPRMVLASITAFFISQNLDVITFSFLKQKTHGKLLWLRNNLSTMSSQLIDSTIFMFIFFGGILSTSMIIKKIGIMYTFKLIFALCDTPFVYLGKYIFKRKQN
jgi:hypothetical protein